MDVSVGRWSELTRDEQLARLIAMGELSATSPQWPGFMANVIDLPMTMLGAVQHALRAQAWVKALRPVYTLREQAERKWARDSKAEEEWKCAAANKPAKGE